MMLMLVICMCLCGRVQYMVHVELDAAYMLTSQRHKLFGSSDCDFKGMLERSTLWHALVKYAFMRRLPGRRLAAMLARQCKAHSTMLCICLVCTLMIKHTQHW